MLFKKYPLYLISFILSVVTIFLYPLKTQAEVVCSNWDNAITESWEQHNWYQEERNDVGIFYDFTWDKEKKIIKIKRNKENYPVVRFSLFNKIDITEGSIIKSYNNINLSKKNDLEIKAIHKKNEMVKIEPSFEE